VILVSSNRNQALAIAERLRAGVEAAGMPHEGTESGVVTVSAGLAFASPVIGSSPANLVKDADALLYEAKRAGRNRVSIG
jgi:diguanylate cyclase (GGDEF)-like protein